MEKKARKIEKCKGGERKDAGAGKKGRDVETGIGAVRDFEEGNISIDVRFIDLPPSSHTKWPARVLRATS